MARSLSNSKHLVALVADGLSLPVFRRGYAAAPQGAVTASYGRGGGSSGMMGKGQGGTSAMKEESGACSAWAPDPVTGYYRPANRPAEIDPAELREMLLNHRVRPR